LRVLNFLFFLIITKIFENFKKKICEMRPYEARSDGTGPAVRKILSMEAIYLILGI